MNDDLSLPPLRQMACDILIIGAGPAGMAAAIAAAECGKRILVLDDNPRMGGQIWRDGPTVRHGLLASRYRRRFAEAGGIGFLPGCKIQGAIAPHRLLFEDQDGGGVIAWKRLILCTGARELLLPFPGWTLPGVTGAGGLQALVKGGMSLTGQRVVVAGSGPLLLSVAKTAREAGAKITAIAEQAPLDRLTAFTLGLWRWPGKAVQAARLIDPHYRTGIHVVEAIGTDRLEAVRLRQGEREFLVPCDRLACGFGLVANTELGVSLGCRVQDGALAVDQHQTTSEPGIYAAGECAGVGGSELALCEGEIAGYAACGDQAKADALVAKRDHWRHFAARLADCFALAPRLKTLARPDTLLCRCEDVSYAQVTAAGSWIAAKLASRSGMGPCQGKVCATAAAHLFGWRPPDPRFPLTPIRVDTLLRAEDVND